VHDGDTIESRNRLSTVIDTSRTRNRYDLTSPAKSVSEQLLRTLLAEDLGSIQELGDVFIKGSTGLEEGLEVISMAIRAAWEVLNREWIARVYVVLQSRATDRIDSVHLSKKSGMTTLTSSWDEIMSAPWMVWGQKPKMS
jgi:hypothetical protein